MLDIDSLLASLKLVDYMVPTKTPLKDLQILFCTLIRSLASGDYGRPITGARLDSLLRMGTGCWPASAAADRSRSCHPSQLQLLAPQQAAPLQPLSPLCC